MAINTTTNKWDSVFTVKAAAFFAAPGYVDTSQPDVVRNIIQNIVTPGGTPGNLYDCESKYGGSILGKCLLFEKTFFTAYDPLNPALFSDQVASWLANPTAVTENYSSTPIPGQFLGDNLVIEPPNTIPLDQNFFVSSPVKHDAGDGTIHIVIPAVPGPLPILGLGATFSFTRRLRRRCRTAAKSA